MTMLNSHEVDWSEDLDTAPTNLFPPVLKPHNVNVDQYGYVASNHNEKGMDTNHENDLKSYDISESWLQVLPYVFYTLGTVQEKKLRTSNTNINPLFIEDLDKVINSEEDFNRLCRADMFANWSKSCREWSRTFPDRMKEKRLNYTEKKKLKVLGLDHQPRKKLQLQYKSAKELLDSIHKNPHHHEKSLKNWVYLTWEQILQYTLKSCKTLGDNDENYHKYQTSLTILWGKLIGFNTQTNQMICFHALNPSRTWFASITQSNTRKLMTYLKLDKVITNPISKIMKGIETILSIKKLFKTEQKSTWECHKIVYNRIDTYMEQLYHMGVFATNPADFGTFASTHAEGIMHQFICKERKKHIDKLAEGTDSIQAFIDTMIDVLNTTTAGGNELSDTDLGARIGQGLSGVYSTYHGDITTTNIINTVSMVESTNTIDGDYISVPAQLADANSRAQSTNQTPGFNRTPYEADIAKKVWKEPKIVQMDHDQNECPTTFMTLQDYQRYSASKPKVFNVTWPPAR